MISIKCRSEDVVKSTDIPKHVAIIMDGNGRWAKNRMIKRLNGHQKGAHVVKDIIKCCCDFGVPILTLYAFSTENWKRPKPEVAGLMKILENFLDNEQKFLFENKIKLNAIGQLHRLPLSVRKTLYSVINCTKRNKKMQLNLALSYGGRSEITNMVIRIASEVKAGTLVPENITFKLISKYLSTRGLPDPDLLIRTGGEMRISNFLLWQIAYTEIFFTKTLWPDFKTEEFIRILKEFPKRNRRFGSVVV